METSMVKSIGGFNAARVSIVSAVAAAAASPALAASTSTLKQDDFVGISFWIISMALIASTVFFFLERDRVAAGA